MIPLCVAKDVSFYKSMEVLLIHMNLWIMATDVSYHKSVIFMCTLWTHGVWLWKFLMCTGQPMICGFSNIPYWKA